MKNPRSSLSKSRKAEIAELAEMVFQDYCKVIPSDPLAVLDACEITHCFGHYGDSFDGLLEYEDARFHVYCNLDRNNLPNSPRARFTLAHELGHFFIEEHRWGLQSGRVKPHYSTDDRKSSDLLPEQEADLFGSTLLMPPSLFRTVVRKNGIGLDCVMGLVKAFDVSFRCAAIRYIEEEVTPSAIVFWNDEGYCWKWLSRSFFRVGFRKTIEDLSLIPPDSATGLAFQDRGVRGQAAIHHGASVVSAWFPFVTTGSHRNIILNEHAMRLGHFGVLTFIDSNNPRDFERLVSIADSI